MKELEYNIPLSSSTEGLSVTNKNREKHHHKHNSISTLSRRKSYFETFLVGECERISERKEKQEVEMTDPYTEGIIRQYLNVSNRYQNDRKVSQHGEEKKKNISKDNERDRLVHNIGKGQKEEKGKVENEMERNSQNGKEGNEINIDTDTELKFNMRSDFNSDSLDKNLEKVNVEDRQDIEKQSQSQGGSRHDLVLQDLFQLSASDKIQNNMIKFHFRHIGTLFLINQSRTGKISQEELKLYTALVEDLHLKIASYQEVEVRLRSYSTLSLWIEIKRDRNSFINWFLSLLIENSKEVTKYNLYKASMERFGSMISCRSSDQSIDSSQRRQSSCKPEPDIDSTCHLDSFSEEDRADIKDSLICKRTDEDCDEKRMEEVKEPENEIKDSSPSDSKLPFSFNLGHENETQFAKEIEDDSENEEYSDDDANVIRLDSGYTSVFQLLLTRGEEFVDSDTLLLMHFLLEIESGYGISFQTFLDMLQQEAERYGLISLSDEVFDQVVPVPVLRTFIEDFVNGFESLMDAMKIEDAEELLVYCLS